MVSSFLPAAAFGPGRPSKPMYGRTRSNSGVGLLPSMAFFYKPEDSPWCFAFGGLGAGGLFTNLPASPANPILSPRPPNGFGAGPIYTSVNFNQFALTASYQITDRLSIGMGPTVTAEAIQVNPALFAAPDPTGAFPSATNTRLYWGLGFEAGIYYKFDYGFAVGASFKSRQWMQTIEYEAADSRGFPRTLHKHVDFPMIPSVGVSYSGLERFLFAVDARYIDFRNTPGFGDPAGFDSAGRVTGPGWRSVFELAAGVQYHCSDPLWVRAGYQFNGNPVPDENAFFNAAGASIYQHSLYLGASYQFTPALTVSLTWGHSFHNAISGPFFAPAGAVPSSAVRIDQTSDALDLLVSVKF
jgi:long-chain fatty acid transport protein